MFIHAQQMEGLDANERASEQASTLLLLQKELNSKKADFKYEIIRTGMMDLMCLRL